MEPQSRNYNSGAYCGDAASEMYPDVQHSLRRVESSVRGKVVWLIDYLLHVSSEGRKGKGERLHSQRIWGPQLGSIPPFPTNVDP